MNEMELLSHLREEVPAALSPRAERLFLAALADDLEAGRSGATRPARSLVRRGRNAVRALRPAWRLAITVPLAAGLAAGAVAVTGTGPAGRPATTLTVQLLANRAAAVARSGQPVSPGQWVYRKVSTGSGRAAQEFWATADDQKEAFYANGTLVTCSFAGSCDPSRVDGMAIGVGFAQGGDISFAALGSLPASPRALVSYLEHLKARDLMCGADAASCRAFGLIGQLLTAYVTPPGIAAELFQALGDIPGVTVVEHATDPAGRVGVAFRLSFSPPAPAWEEIVLNPRTYQFMAWVVPSKAGLVGKAVTVQALVPGPGVRP